MSDAAASAYALRCRAIGKVGARVPYFISACALLLRRERERVARMFRLSYEELEILEGHFAAEIRCWPQMPDGPRTPPIDYDRQLGERDPDGDKDGG
jgi:hypothetical protein